MSESVKKYLIRSSGHILGPYNKKEIESLIEDGMLSINDEIVEPFSVALYIRDHSEFVDLVQSMSVENHMTNLVMNLSGKFSTVTRKTVKKLLKDTQTLTEPLNKKGEDLSQVEDADFKLIEEKIPKKQTDSSKYQTIKESERMTRKKVKSVMRRFWQAIIVFSLFVVGFIFFNEFIYPYKEKKKLLEKVKKEGVHFYNSGNYLQSFEIFERGSKQNILGIEEKKILLNLLMQQRKTEQAEILLREIESSLSPSHVFLIKGLIAFFERSYSVAENFFLKVKGENQDIGFINLTLLKWLQEDHQSVLNKTNEMISKGYERGLIFYLKNFSLLKMGIEKNQIKSFIKNNLQLSPEYYQELTLLLAYLYIEENNLTKIEELVKNILDWDHDFYREYSYNSLIPVDTLNWSLLFRYCEKLFKMNTENYLLTALYGFCNIKIGSNERGLQYVEKSKNQNPKDDLILSVFAYNLMKKESFLEAEVFLNKIQKSSYKLPYILKARFFERRGKWNLALKHWEELIKKDPYNLSALGGMAFGNYKIKNYDSMKVYKDRGLTRYPYYVKLLSLP